MAAAGGSGAEADKKWHYRLMHKISKLLTAKDFRRLKQLFTDQLARIEIDESDDVFLFLALLERRDHIGVGRYDVLIDNLETLEFNECVRAIKEHTKEIKKCRRTQTRREKLDRYIAPASAKVNKIDKKGKTPVMRAAEDNDVTRVRSLIETGADVNLTSRDSQALTALMLASKKGHTEVAAELIITGADVNTRDKDGCTALMFSSLDGYKDIVAELIEEGADVNTRDMSDETALIKAAGNGCHEVVAELIEAGADVNIQDKDDDTALILAAVRGDKEVVAELIEAGADVNIRETNGMTALDLAKSLGHTELRKILQNATTK